MKRSKLQFKIFSTILFCALFFISSNCFAKNGSMVYFTGPGTTSVGSTFSINVSLDAAEPINALNLEIVYPKDKFKFLGFDNTHSIVNIWQPTPTLNSFGNIAMAGGMFKSFVGTDGLIIKLSFKTLAGGDAKFSFAKNEAYLADGKGTKIPLANSIFSLHVGESIAPSATTPDDTVIIDASEDPALPVDTTPPELVVGETKSPVDGANLITFYATDNESGIKATQMRIKRWWSYSEWVDVNNPVLRPANVWSVEIKAVNNANLETVKSVVWRGELYKKIFILVFLFFVLVFCAIWVYTNRSKRYETP